jgi:four helix bundle protein
MALHIYAIIIELIRRLHPIVQQIARHDPNLADQLRRALTSIALNTKEGSYSQGRNIRARFHDALGSAGEVKAGLDVAEAFTYIETLEPEVRDMLDHVVATLYRLARR